MSSSIFSDSARFQKQDEDGQMFDQIELYIKLGIIRNLT